MASAPVYQTKSSDVHKVLGKWILADGFPLVYDMDKSQGSFLVDKITGKKYLDLFSFFASMPLGHNHPALQDPDFLARLQQTAVVKPSNSDIYTEAMADFVATLGRTMPPGFNNLFFIEGGALAVENALKVAFDWKVRKNIAKGLIDGKGDENLGTKVIHFRNAFHGRSGYTLSLTNGFSPDKVKYFPKFDWPRVSTPGATFPLKGENLKTTQAAEETTLGEIRAAIGKHPNEIAAIIIESIQGEGGDVHFRTEFLQQLRTLCDEEEVILIFDEIQCGMGLTGKWWAFEHHGVVPDIFSFGKKAQVCGIAAGERVNEVDSCFKVSSRINSTWGGSLVDMVRCARYIETIERENLLANATEVGAHLLDKLTGLEAKFDAVSNARGRGLMCAFDLPTPEQRDNVQRALMERDVLILPCGPKSLRFRPHLDVTKENIDLGLDKVTAVLEQL